jgi:hypothetical protein
MIAKVSPILLTIFMGTYLLFIPAKIQFSLDKEQQSGFEFSVSYHSENPFLAHASLRGVYWGLLSQIEDLRCGENELDPIEEIMKESVLSPP